MNKPFDIVIYGATSVVGEIITRYMVNRYGVDGEIKWAIAGRSEAKLLQVKRNIGAQNVTHLIADVSSEGQLRYLTEQARVILSTVGPYAIYGEPLIKACVESGTDYCDITGEVHWVSAMIRKYDAAAKKSGARIVHCSGFDSIPSDMGLYFLQEAAKEAFGEYCNEVKNRVAKFKGHMSGGSFASFINVINESKNNSQVRTDLDDPYSACPPNHGYTARQSDLNTALFDGDFDAWTAPFLIAPTNTKIVHRSNALLDSRYGTNFLYHEASLAGRGSKGRRTSLMLSLSLKMFWTLGAIKPTRWLLEKFMPKAGEGPTIEQQENGFFELRFIGHTPSKQRIRIKVTGDKDPGYGSTSQIVAESAICLLQTPTSVEGGFWTPSSLYGERLIDRLQKNAGLTFEVVK
ncbi:saccharopine dehydrogenase NADP-binding domain-containing protein [Microbulbifer agarilyticus]|uniref:saccharopine dehydrogenase family protein n=1 Tax=Microbulbifer agarilyticus TaxID=260552 RepID=UPI001C97CE1B|nr:saccharopine dehydrogenase NADP-binding domain-containing protein [Microbulbifer agarilyticus]MBY6191108.1 saccharopine dehydrogenase NADP-binding domain-containing protein [Microbulbifer agarilyticus]